MQLGPVLDWERQVGQDVVLARVHQVGELGPAGAELIGELAPSLPGRRLVRLQEGLAQRGGDHRLLAPRYVRQGVP